MKEKGKKNKDKKKQRGDASYSESVRALHITWTKPNLNEQQNHLALTLSL